MVQPSSRLDASFAALSNATRRGVIERRWRQDATITEWAERFQMTLTGMKKHVDGLDTMVEKLTRKERDVGRKK